MTTMPLQGALVYLDYLQEKYIPEYQEAFSPLVQQWLHCRSWDSELELLQSYIATTLSQDSYFYGIFNKSTNKLVGSIVIRKNHSSAGQLYSWINEAYWGTGMYQEALTLASNDYFARTGALFFTAHVDVTNPRSHQALKKNGFADSGIVQGPHGKQYELCKRNNVSSFN